MDTSLFDEPVYFIEQFGQLLNLVHNDQPVAPFQFLAKARRPVAEGPEDITIEQVIDFRRRQGTMDQGGLARLARTKKEKRFPPREPRDVEGPRNVARIGH